MLFRECNGIQWLEFELLAECPIVHGCLMRKGGESEGIWSSLNLGEKVGDVPAKVQANRKKVREAMAFKKIVGAKLCHGSTVLDVAGVEEDLPSSDALSTQTAGFGLMVTQADCQAAIVYDPIRHAIANVHCGWRGNVQNIYGSAVEHMKAIYGSRPADLLVCISPSLGPDNAEFSNYQTELPESFWDFQRKPEYFDLWAISEWQLIEAGVLKQHIQIAGIDTYANVEDYFSYRRSTHFGSICGRQGTICGLKDKNN